MCPLDRRPCCLLHWARASPLPATVRSYKLNASPIACAQASICASVCEVEIEILRDVGGGLVSMALYVATVIRIPFDFAYSTT